MRCIRLPYLHVPVLTLLLSIVILTKKTQLALFYTLSASAYYVTFIKTRIIILETKLSPHRELLPLYISLDEKDNIEKSVHDTLQEVESYAVVKYFPVILSVSLFTLPSCINADSQTKYKSLYENNSFKSVYYIYGKIHSVSSEKKWRNLGKKNYAPFKKGAYCFATVGRSICRSVDQVLSAQYLLAPSFDQIKLSAGLALNE